MFVSRLSVVALALFVLPACAGTALGRLSAAARTPSDGSAGGPSPDTMKVQMIKPAEWSEEAPKEKLAPSCDARSGAGKANAAEVDGAKKVIDMYAEFRKTKPKPPPPSGPTVGDVVGLQRSNNDIYTLAFACGEKSTLDVNGSSYAFDLAWALVGPKPEEVSIFAISLKDKKSIFAYVKSPTAAERAKNPKASSDETFVLTNVAAYMPADPNEPLVRNMSTKAVSPSFEALLFAKGATEGFYWRVPTREDFAPGKFLGVGRFKVGEPQ